MAHQWSGRIPCQNRGEYHGYGFASSFVAAGADCWLAAPSDDADLVPVDPGRGSRLAQLSGNSFAWLVDFLVISLKF